jgi:hypothetical protein
MKSLVLRLSVLSMVMLSFCAGIVTAEEGRLRVKKTVEFKLDSETKLNIRVGPMFIDSVAFENRGSGTTRSKVFGVLRRSGSAETAVTLRCALEVENPKEDEWELTATIEFLDSKGELIDRVRSSREFEGEADTWTIDHDILGYVIPLISEVRIEFQAELD